MKAFYQRVDLAEHRQQVQQLAEHLRSIRLRVHSRHRLRAESAGRS